MTEEERKDMEGLMYLKWSWFDSPDSPGSGYKFMERDTVLLLDKAVRTTRLVPKIELAYTTPYYAKVLGLVSTDSHRIGKAVRLRVTHHRMRMKVVAALIKHGAKRIAVGYEVVYFDTDNVKEPALYLWC